MLRRWCIPLAGLGLVLGSVAAAGTASAAPAQHTTTHVMVDSAGNAKDSVSSLSGGNSFKVTWLRSN